VLMWKDEGLELRILFHQSREPLFLSILITVYRYMSIDFFQSQHERMSR
jgi:hypothetical protein